MDHPFRNGPDKGHTRDGSTATLLTARMFFGRDGETPYETSSNFLAFGESLRPKEASDWQKLLQCMSEGMRMDGNPATGVDVGKRPYVFHRAYKAKAVLGFKMINGGGMPKLVEDYQSGLVSIGFTLNELIEEARKG